jgi:hypothetical protein
VPPNTSMEPSTALAPTVAQRALAILITYAFLCLYISTCFERREGPIDLPRVAFLANPRSVSV